MGSLIKRQKRAKIIMELYRHWIGFFKAIVKLWCDYDIDAQEYKDG
jgi:hypothetical protein